MTQRLLCKAKSLVTSALLSACLLVACSVTAMAVIWDLESDTWVATDALGRVLPGSTECGAPKTNKTVGIFYYIWLGQHGTDGPYDNTELKKQNAPAWGWGPENSFHHWGQSELGYYLSEDPYVIRRHLQMLNDAGVDVIFFDVTNSFTYKPVYMSILNIYQQARNEGIKTPQIGFMLNSSVAATAQALYDDLYSKNLYPDLWFKWLGKPLILCKPAELPTALQSYFTARNTWAWQGGQDIWNWIDDYPQRYGWHTSSTVVEETSVCAGGHAATGKGRSYTSSYNSSGTFPTLDSQDLCATTPNGLQMAEQWTRIGTGTGKINPDLLFITQWNEWVAQMGYSRGTTDDWMAGHSIPAGYPVYNDCYNQEFSRDIEPMKQGHTDNYYYQMISGLRKYTGVKSAMGAGIAKTIAIDGNFSEWLNVQPEYRDSVGDVEHRDSLGWGTAGRYVNNSGRNDFVRMKVARDANNVYFYAETYDNITSRTDTVWMLLFIDSDCSASTGWHGYDYVLNFDVESATTTSLWQNAGGWDWNPISSSISYSVVGNKMEIAVPRSAIGKAGTANVALNFHWADNSWDGSIEDGDIAGFFLNGDSAPNRRFNYRYDTSVSGPPWEYNTSGNVESWTAVHSLSNLSCNGSSLVFDISGADPYIEGSRYPDVNADLYRYIQIRMKSTGNTSAEFFWGTLADPNHRGGREVAFTVTADGQFHDYLVDMSGHSEWKGLVNKLRLDPSSGSTGHVEIDYIRFMPDIILPAGSVSIDTSGGAVSSDVTLSLSATDTGAGISKMCFSNDNVTWTPWESYATSKLWTLSPSGDGSRTVYVKYRDKYYNESPTYSATVIVTAGAPVGTVVINGGAMYCTSSSVILSLSAIDPAGVAQMRLSNNNITWSAWETYATTKTWSLLPGDGPKTVYAQFKDGVGVESDSVTASVILDSSPPYGTVGINEGALYTTSAEVTLQLDAADEGTGVSSMRFSSDGSSWTSWEAYSTSKPWTLSSGDGEKLVYFQFRDVAGNMSETANVSIVLDNDAPSAPVALTDSGAFTTSTSIAFNWTAATDSGSGIDGYTCEIGNTPGGNNVFSGNVGGALSWTVSGTYGKRYYCRVQARDKVGHSSSWSVNSDGITVVQNSGGTISDAKGLTDTSSVGLSSRVVSAIFGSSFYVEESDRFAGVLVQPDALPAGLVVGSLVDVGGILATDSNNERRLDATVKLLAGSANILPIAMSNRSIGGGDWQYSTSPVKGQKGITGSSGLNNIGLLIKTYGVVSSLDSSNFYITDGSGVTVQVRVPAGITVPTAGSYMVVTGISSCTVAGSSLVRLILVRDTGGMLQIK